jgi:hypothetical protein
MIKRNVPARYTDEALEAAADLGPAMRALNPRRRAFVLALFDLGDHPSNADCARAAGYEGDTNYIALQGYRLSHAENVQAAIREEADRRCTTLLPLAHRRMTELMSDAKPEVRLAALKHQQALTGMSPKQVHVVEHINDRSALIREIEGSMKLLQSLGVNIATEALVPKRKEAIEADFEEVGTNSGLEDLL